MDLVPTIRRAKPADAQRVIALCRASHAAAGFDRTDGPYGFHVPFNEAYADRLFHLHFSSRRCSLVLDTRAGVQGVLMAASIDHDFGPVRLARETLWWIDPAHRGRAAIRMLDAYEDWAYTGQGCAFAGMAGMGGDPEIAALYERRGYVRAETHFLKKLAG